MTHVQRLPAPLPDLAAIPSGLKGRGWSDARAFAHTQLIKNPNAYFYRHVAPHEQQVGSRGLEAPSTPIVPYALTCLPHFKRPKMRGVGAPHSAASSPLCILAPAPAGPGGVD